MIHVGDCLDVMRTLEPDSVDAIVTDPPYGIGFMGKAWDGKDIEARMVTRRAAPSRDPSAADNGAHRSAAAAAGAYDLSPQGMRAFQQFSADWAREAIRVLKPGGYLVSFAAARTYHRMVCGFEEAGLEVRDQILWIFGSGFPKSKNLDGDWEGWGTALKPAHEPICLARKPLIGTVAANVAAFGTGALNIDGCRIASEPMPPNTGSGGLPRRDADEVRGPGVVAQPHELGRWPANVIHDGSDEVLAAFPSAPGQQGDLTGDEPSRPAKNAYGEFAGRRQFKARRDGEASAQTRYTERGGTDFAPLPGMRRAPEGSAARFFYCAKASRADRNDGCDGMEAKPLLWSSGTHSPVTFQAEGTRRASENNHPTVKPTDLMRWLCRLVTPPGGLILDPFTGSGSTGRGAIAEGFRFVGIELDPDYAAIAEARIRVVQPGLSFGSAA